jgi:hypothetical protein
MESESEKVFNKFQHIVKLCLDTDLFGYDIIKAAADGMSYKFFNYETKCSVSVSVNKENKLSIRVKSRYFKEKIIETSEEYITFISFVRTTSEASFIFN